MKRTLGELARRLRGTLTGLEPGREYTGFALDNREVQAGNVFLAIKGHRVDGHEFVSDSLLHGAVASVVERAVDGPQILVENLEAALARFGRSFRDEFNGPVIGVTGSNGKTSTKEFVDAACRSLGPSIKSPGNRNTEWTSPLLWNDLTPQTAYAVVEMSMRGFRQISHLTHIARPTVAIITMIGSAHVEMVESREGIARSKAEIFESMDSDGVSILWREDEFYDFLRSQSPGRVRTVGFSQESEFQVVGYRAISLTECQVLLQLDGQKYNLTLPTIGRHQALNAAAALLAAHSVGVPIERGIEDIATAEIPAMRMEVLERDGVTILLDTYNASPDSMIAALKALIELPCSGQRLAVIGEMRELGTYSESAHRAVGREIAESGLDRVALLGDQTEFVREEAIQTGYSASKIFFKTSIEEVACFIESCEPGDLVLVKGSRALGLERAVGKGH